MAGHHLILGELTDFITHETLVDTHDERLRQGLAERLVNEKGFSRGDIRPRWPLTLKAGEKCAVINIDFGIIIDSRVCMMIKYGPGSLVTRHRPALAVSRLLAAYQIPVVVVTNGMDADILDGASAKVVARGLDAVPDKAALKNMVAGRTFDAIQPGRAEMESRIAFAFEVDGSCPCDDTVCIINDE
jgi:hypothetical protein